MINILEEIYDLINWGVSWYSPTPSIDWHEAEQGETTPNIILNDISDNSNIIGRRLTVLQVSVWENSKIKSSQLRNLIIEILNRYKWGNIKFITFKWSVPAFDSKTKEHGYHLTFMIKSLDKNM